MNERDEDWVDDFYAHRLAVGGRTATRAASRADERMVGFAPQ